MGKNVEHKRLHLESSKQNYYIISLRAIIKAIFTSHPFQESHHSVLNPTNTPTVLPQCIRIYIDVCVYVCLYAYVYIYIYIYMHIHIYKYMYLYIHKYVYIMYAYVLIPVVVICQDHWYKVLTVEHRFFAHTTFYYPAIHFFEIEADSHARNLTSLHSRPYMKLAPPNGCDIIIQVLGCFQWGQACQSFAAGSVYYEIMH